MEREELRYGAENMEAVCVRAGEWASGREREPGGSARGMNVSQAAARVLSTGSAGLPWTAGPERLRAGLGGWAGVGH
eukprot:2417057-Rhodomonas_salina.1